jgi:hypothetical protein
METSLVIVRGHRQLSESILGPRFIMSSPYLVQKTLHDYRIRRSLIAL